MKLRTRKSSLCKSSLCLAAVLACASSAIAQSAPKPDTSTHSARMVSVEPSVNLEVLDWGGSGQTLILLAGMGDTAHVFDTFATKLTGKYHVYGITRRGFGVSSKPDFVTSNYKAARLGDDVLAVIAALHLGRPVLAGHSFGGEELSDIGFHHPDAVAGLIYLDAGYSYALYDQAHGQFMLDGLRLQEMLQNIIPGKIPRDNVKSLKEIQEQLKLVDREITEYLPLLTPAMTAPGPRPDPPPYLYALFSGQESFPTVNTPTLALFAVPHDFGPPDNSPARAQLETRDLRITEYQVKAFETQVPTARIVRMPHASHYIFVSNEGDVLREIDAFISTLKK